MNELAKSLEQKQEPQITNYKIDRNGFKNAKVNKPLKFSNKKIIAIGLGTIMIASMATFISKNNDKSQEVSENQIVTTLPIETEQIEEVKSKNTGWSFKTANFEVGNAPDTKYINEFIETPEYKVIEKYAKYYGIDPYIMSSIALKESSLNHEDCLPGGKYYNGCAIGMMQLEQSSKDCVYNGDTITAYNYETGEYDKINYTLENVKNYETNIQIACMKFQNTLEKYHGNLYLAIQSHNYGTGMMDSILSKTASQKNIDINYMIDHPFDVDWTNHLDNAHNHPLDYISEWEYDTFGNPNYIYSVINCCPNEEAQFIYDGKEVTFDLRTGHMREQNKIK